MKKILGLFFIILSLSVYSKEEITYHDNGYVKSIMNYEDGKLQGVSRWYYDSGKLETEQNYIDGRMDGLSTWY
jgi:antitoxin component YwqK of YwqJK toxin-antitoxin module